ncbi:MAG: spore germination protein GerW family protein [Thaumarchaeota archaeon]|nr:spore germination protein GerW family protein [Nitrososphaerota archaeon]
MSAEDEIHILTTLVEELKRLLEPKSIIGDRIELEDKTIIPLTKIGAAFGSGIGGGKGKGGEKQTAEGEGTGSGAGGGGGLTPVAMIVVFKGIPGPDGIKVIPLEKESSVSKAITDVMPSVTEAVKRVGAGSSKEKK